MINYVETKISLIEDADFKVLVSDLCRGLGDWEPSDFDRFSTLMMSMGLHKKKLTLLHVPTSRILQTRVDKLVYGSVVYCVCEELVRLNNTLLDEFYGKKVLILINRCYKVFCPKPRMPKKLIRR